MAILLSGIFEEFWVLLFRGLFAAESGDGELSAYGAAAGGVRRGSLDMLFFAASCFGAALGGELVAFGLESLASGADGFAVG